MDYGGFCGSCDLCSYAYQPNSFSKYTCCEKEYIVQSMIQSEANSKATGFRSLGRKNSFDASNSKKPPVLYKSLKCTEHKPSQKNITNFKSIKEEDENCQVLKSKNLSETFRKTLIHPDDCTCVECCKTKNSSSTADFSSEIELKNTLLKKSSKNSNSLKMSKSSSERNMKNYLYDNPELKIKPSIETTNLEEDLNSDLTDCWILQCPKNVDVNELLGCKLSKSESFKCNAESFTTPKTLALITEERAAEYQCVCPNLKLFNPIGKIVLTAANDSLNVESDVEIKSENSCNDSDQESKPIQQVKKTSKKIKDQVFTIETKITVEDCQPRKKKIQEKNQPEECLDQIHKKKKIKKEKC